jgi:hypothetical protein
LPDATAVDRKPCRGRPSPPRHLWLRAFPDDSYDSGDGWGGAWGGGRGVPAKLWRSAVPPRGKVDVWELDLYTG